MQTSPIEPVVTAREFMDLLALKKSRFYELKEGGLLPAPLALPGRPRWDRATVREYLQSGRMPKGTGR